MREPVRSERADDHVRESVRSERAKSPGVTDVDGAQTALRIQALAWSGVGGLLGAGLGFLVVMTQGWPPLPSILGGVLLGAFIVYLAGLALGGIAGNAVASVITPTGRSTASVNQFSLAESHVARGRYDAAVAEYEKAADLEPLDPEPRLRLGRLYRDRLNRPEEGMRWLRRARDVATDPALEWLIVRELLELATSRLRDAKQALPDLARLARHADAAAAKWACARIASIKGEVGGGAE